MTHNTINYASLMETKRANEAREVETHRSNVAMETENRRAHLANEELQRASIAAQNYATAQNAANVAARIAADKAMQANKLASDYKIAAMQVASKGLYGTAVAGLTTYGGDLLSAAKKGVNTFLDFATRSDLTNAAIWKGSSTTSTQTSLYKQYNEGKGLQKFNAMSNYVALYSK